MLTPAPSDRRFDVPGREPCVEVVSNAMVAVYREKQGWERREIASALWRSARKFLRDTILAQHPDWEEDQIRREVLRRLGRGME